MVYVNTMKQGNLGLDSDFIGEHWGRNLPVDRVEYSRAALGAPSPQGPSLKWFLDGLPFDGRNAWNEFRWEATSDA